MWSYVWTNHRNLAFAFCIVPFSFYSLHFLVKHSDGMIWPQEKTIGMLRYYTEFHDMIRLPNAMQLNEWRRHTASPSDHAVAVSR